MLLTNTEITLTTIKGCKIILQYIVVARNCHCLYTYVIVTSLCPACPAVMEGEMDEMNILS